jgi:CRP-like cAMP-binding protein
MYETAHSKVSTAYTRFPNAPGVKTGTHALDRRRAMVTNLFSPKRHPPKDNGLLAALPVEVFQRLLPHLESFALPLGWPVYEAGSRMAHVFFPTAGIVSLLTVTKSGASSEIAITGKEGLVGISLFMGSESTTSRAVVQSAGQAYRLRADFLRAEFNRGGELQRILLRFTQALITQMAQTAVCNRHHTVEQHLCRWLLLSLDRLPSNVLNMTHDLVANMLGMHRDGVTEAVRLLEEAGLIEYSRGHFTVPDRSKLEQRVCECYAVVKHEADRLLH